MCFSCAVRLALIGSFDLLRGFPATMLNFSFSLTWFLLILCCRTSMPFDRKTVSNGSVLDTLYYTVVQTPDRWSSGRSKQWVMFFMAQ